MPSTSEKDQELKRAESTEVESAEKPVAAPSSEEELEVPEDAAGTVRRLWAAARGLRWRLVVAAVC